MEVEHYTDSVQENHQQAIEEAGSLGTFEAWVDGESRAAASGETFETRDPVVDEPILSVPRCDHEDVDAAVEAAWNAYDGEWGETTPAERSRTLQEWVGVLRDNLDELALLESLDTGKPLAYAEGEVTKGLDFIEYYANICRAEGGKQIAAANDAHIYTRREPYGVVGCVTPWNYPLVLTSWKIGPALAAGNSVVLKPAEQSPLTALRIAELSEGILPDGVFNVVPGFGDEAGASVTGHADVRKVSFTGEDVTGEAVMSAAAENITPVTLELGGKSPFVVFPDADVEQAAETVAGSITYNTGQSCDACSRAIVHEDVRDEFVEHLVEEVESHTIGDPLSEETTFGPLVSEAQYEKVNSYLELGVEEGATLATGGNTIDDDSLEDGWYVEPAVFVDADNDMRIAQEEIFGPVETVITFETYEEAIELANDVEFGLAAGVATENGSLAHRAASDIDAGSIWVNKYYGRTVTGSPFGGFKRSGMGRECARDTLKSYTQEKTVHVPIEQDPTL
ncbi:aldehyde dehydrogenase family protein [Haloferax sp. MBLA0076]|uniref:Aldehyde dehydrogenase family protein n=1 Tax=Haloferax litoreum TaxID=2666140 RepID=A0A6A8GKY6_9EURY|nr:MULTISPECIES: aldehyde dehydrogenase family protein [Haloferax]KAB1190554.1 aldehyde dehydrogenase [Haloferax sp. CBA1148]MRX23539.1 aldehyde dehydrogenase family protein [Haloferax litoreum]